MNVRRQHVEACLKSMTSTLSPAIIDNAGYLFLNVYLHRNVVSVPVSKTSILTGSCQPHKNTTAVLRFRINRRYELLAWCPAVSVGQVGGRRVRLGHGERSGVPPVRHHPHAAAAVAHALPRVLPLRAADHPAGVRARPVQGLPAPILQPGRVQGRDLHHVRHAAQRRAAPCAAAAAGAHAHGGVADGRRSGGRRQRLPRGSRGARTQPTAVVRNEGVTAMWKGLTTTVIRDSLGVAFYFLGYDFAKQRLTASGKLGETATLLTAGAFGGVSFWAVALPFDTIKSLIQADGRDGKYTGLVSSTAKLVREEGVMQLFRGWQAAFSRGIPSAAITFWTFERANKFLNEM
ncbi:hypothetical protein ON010_g15829 [Phytophthora cinnamomi]|nr:hypothetical protein ON010_g15829 [Phytophthora cinnamomi]